MKTHKKRISLGLYIAGLMGLLALTPASIHAQNTAAGTDVVNTATVSYQVDNVDQPDETGSVTFEVDALINPVVAVSNAPTIVPGESGVVITYTVTNSGNQNQDFVLDADNRTDDDGFDLGTLKVYRDTNSNGTYDAGIDQEVDISVQGAGQTNRIDGIAADDSVTIFVVGDIPAKDASGGSVANGESITVDLIAVAYKADDSGIETETGTPAQGTVDTVFGDGDGPADGDDAVDGEHSATATLSTDDVTITVTKTAEVVDDGLGGTEQFYIPGATVRYTITIVYDGSTTTTANSIVMSDPIPTNTTFVTGSIKLNSEDITDGDDSDEGDYNITTAGNVTVAITGTRNKDSDNDVITFDVTID